MLTDVQSLSRRLLLLVPVVLHPLLLVALKSIGGMKTKICGDFYLVFTLLHCHNSKQDRTGSMQENPVIKSGLTCNHYKISPVTGKTSKGQLISECFFGVIV